jgi:gluconolactonase
MKRGERTPYSVDRIIHIRAVDHPESISVGPAGEAYTTGTGGQMYRLDLQANTACQFASVAPRRILGQAVDADGNLYCADTTTGQVVRITPNGQETTYARARDGFLCANYPAFDRSGNLFLSDSGDWSDEVNGRLFRIPPGGGEAVLWFPDPLDTPNAIAFDADEKFLYFVETFCPGIARIGINSDGSAAELELVLSMPRHVPDGIAFDEAGRLWIACHRPDAIYVFDTRSRRLELFCEDWMGNWLRGPTDVAFAGAERNILLASSLDNLVVHRFDDIGARGLKLNYPRIDGPFQRRSPIL